MQYSHNLNAALDDEVEDYVLSYWKTAQPVNQFIPASLGLGVLKQDFKPCGDLPDNTPAALLFSEEMKSQIYPASPICPQAK